jgi:hypothetical protein
MLKLAKKHTHSVLRHFGVQITRIQHAPLADLRGVTDNPLEGFYRANGRPFLLEVPMEKCFSIGFWGTDPHNPFVQTLRAYGQGSCPSYKGSPLEDFYEHWQPGPAHLHSGITAGEAYPWSCGLLRSAESAQGRHQRKEFKEIQKQLGYGQVRLEGHIKQGPVSEGFGQITFNRLIQVYESIKQNGYLLDQQGYKHITARLFLSEADYRAEISSGKHRISALQALGFSTAIIQFGPPAFSQVIRREDVAFWPNVRAGYFSPEEALEVFDEKFQTRHPSGWRYTRG